jgi:hypothetical protein
MRIARIMLASTQKNEPAKRTSGALINQNNNEHKGMPIENNIRSQFLKERVKTKPSILTIAIVSGDENLEIMLERPNEPWR